MIEPIEPLDSTIVYLQFSRNTMGTLVIHGPENPPINWQGYWTKQDEAQHDQMLKALKGVKTHLYAIRIPV